MLEAGAGPLVLLLPGLGDPAETWEEAMSALAKAGYHAVALDLPGHGASDKPRDPAAYRLRSITSLLDTVADELGARRLALVGVSLGGLVAAHYAASQPERVAAQALVAPAGLSPELTPFLRWLARPIIGHFLAAPPKGLLRRGLRAMVRQQRAVPEAFVETYYRYRHTAGAASALVHIMRQGIAKGQLRPDALLPLRLRDCGVPTLLVLGRDDPLVPHRQGEALVAAMPSASLWLVPECGHWPHREHPEAFHERLLAFLWERYPPQA